MVPLYPEFYGEQHGGRNILIERRVIFAMALYYKVCVKTYI